MQSDGASGLGQVKEITELFGGGAIAAAFALLVVAIVVLFVALVREQRAHLKTALMWGPVAEKQEAATRRNTEVLEEAVEVMKEATIVARSVGREQTRRRRSEDDGGTPPRGTPHGPGSAP